MRRVALGLTAALCTARAYSASEPDMERGAGTGLIWVLALFIAAGLAIAAGFVAGRFRFRWSWTDAAVSALVILVAASATHALDRRPAINLAWEWIALGMAYLLIRNLPRTRDESFALAGALVATAVAVSAYGLYQAGVEMPALQAEYRRNPHQFLIRNQVNLQPGTREHSVWENRFLDSNEMFSTFGLANSLAGYIVGPLVLALAVGLQNLGRRDRQGSRWTALVMAAPLFLILLVALILTKSRSAWIGAGVGVLIVAWKSRKDVSTRVLLAIGVAGLLLILALAAMGLATGRLDREVLTQSTLSLRYRWEYWQGTWRMLTGGATDPGTALGSPTLWSGVGPGNFREPYLRYKLPQSSEEVLDPHNLFLEIWATGGIWALLALIAALGLGLGNLLGPPSRSGTGADVDRSPSERRRRRRRRRGSVPETPDSPVGDDDGGGDAPPARPSWLVAWAGAGWAVVVLLGELNPFLGDLFVRWLILGASWLAATMLGRPLWRRLPSPSWAPGAAFAAILINLLAAGGIGIPTVALGFWSLMALGLNLREDRSCGRLHRYESRLPSFSLAAGWAAAVGLFLGAVIPYWQSEAAVAEAHALRMRNPPEFERAEKAFERALAADHYYVRPWLGYADLALGAWRWRGAKAEDKRWEQVPILLEQAVSPPRNPISSSLHIRRAELIRELVRQIGSQLTPVERIRLGGEVVKDTRIATLLYPTNAIFHARLAQASAEISMFGDAVQEAEEALRLDRLTPHPDKKLPDDVRQRLERQIEEWSSARSP